MKKIPIIIFLGFSLSRGFSQTKEPARLAPEGFEAAPQTRISAPELPELECFYDRMVEQVKGGSRTFRLDGVTVRTNPNWIRDHVHEMKGFKFWEKDVTSALDFLCERQTTSGFFYEMFIPNGNPHTTYVNPDCVRRYPADKMALVRLEVEADVEYLMVDGCYQAWQATGDDEWLRQVLPHLVKGLDYCMTDPKRWDATHGLLKRNFTIDTIPGTSVGACPRAAPRAIGG